MKVGSLVECVNNRLYERDLKIGTIYTVRDIIPKGHYFVGHVLMLDCVKVEEVNSKTIYISDWPMPMHYFRELMPPTSISIEEILNEEITV